MNYGERIMAGLEVSEIPGGFGRALGDSAVARLSSRLVKAQKRAGRLTSTGGEGEFRGAQRYQETTGVARSAAAVIPWPKPASPGALERMGVK